MSPGSLIKQTSHRGWLPPTLTLLVLALVWLLPPSAWAVTNVRWVDINSGIDTPGGGLTPTTAWKTLHYAVDQANTFGGTIPYVVNLAQGTYSVANGESNGIISDLIVTGTGGFNIVFRGAPDGTTIVDGTGGGDWITGLILKTNYVSLENINIKNFTANGVRIVSASPIINRCRFQGNGNGVEMPDSAATQSSTIQNSLFVNQINYGIYAHAGTGAPVQPNIYNNTFIGGQKGVYTDGALVTGQIKFNIIHNYTQFGIFANPGSNPTIDYNDIDSPTGTGISGGTDGGHNISVNPDLTSEYRLNTGSPCIDTAVGSNSTIDLDGRFRPYGAGKDMGCFEYYPVYAVNVTIPPGSTVMDYQILSIPLDPDDRRLTAVFGPYIEPYDTTKNRLGRWNPKLSIYEEYPGNAWNLAFPGTGGWIISRAGLNITYTGRKAPTVWITSDYYTRVPLQSGWNQVGNPFDHPVGVADFLAENSLTTAQEPFAAGIITQGIFWVWSGGTYVATNKLPKGGGGWVLLNVAVGGLYVRDLAVAYPDLGTSGALDASTLVAVPDGYERPPDPPAMSGSSGGFSSGGGGGGGGGCFINNAAEW